MESATKGCPASLSFILKAYLPRSKGLRNNVSDYKDYGSAGVGCTIDRAVFATVSKSRKTEIFFNGEKINLPTILTALEKLTDIPLKASIKSSLPLGCGFGISGAATLAALSAINRLLNLKKNFKEIAEISHYAEIYEKTGLGTVATQITGGFLVKSKPGIPVKFRRLPLKGEKIYAVILGKKLTAGILKNRKKINQINYFGESALNKIYNMEKPTLAEILDISYEYWKKSRLFTSQRGEKIIENIRKQQGAATMAIIGKTVLSSIRPTLSKKYKITELAVTDERIKL